MKPFPVRSDLDFSAVQLQSHCKFHFRLIEVRFRSKAAALVEVASLFRGKSEIIVPVEFLASVVFAPRFRSGGRIGAELAGHCRMSP